MTSWYVEGTREAIARVFGPKQLELARPCLRSLYDRQFYARFHYQRAEATLRRYVRSHLKDKDFLPIAFAADEPEWNRFNVVIRKVGADLTACVQSLHAIPDILANAAYYALALDRTVKPEKGRYVNHAFVTDSIKTITPLTDVHRSLRSATTGQRYKQLAALANQSKHYSIVFPELSHDLTGARAEQYLLKLPAFNARGTPHSQVFVNDFLPPIHEQISRSVVATGRAIDEYLKSAS